MFLDEHWLSFDVNGERCHGMLHLPPKSFTGPHPCVTLLHGFSGTMIEPHRIFVHIARALAANGIAAYRFDFRGNGSSEGNFEDMTSGRELEDARAALRMLGARGDLDRSRFGLLGYSLGGMIAALTAGLEPLKALCLVAPATPDLIVSRRFGELRDPLAIRAAFAEGLRDLELPPGMAFDAARGVLDMYGHPVSSRFFEDACTLDSLKAVQNHRGSSLIVHGEKDVAVPLEIGQEYAKTLDAPITIIKESNHGFDALSWHQQCLEATTQFFQEQL
jgi:uncharacterized protein